jgi:hypothetical protein
LFLDEEQPKPATEEEEEVEKSRLPPVPETDPEKLGRSG